ncbi:MAG: hypothetical protein H0U64_12385 [Gemmatimonadaceae bacterium]|nr:hypothetical protein [Gemmatimonadaceae bacterium]
MTFTEFSDNWRRKAEEWTRYSAQVEGAQVIADLLADLEAILRSEDEDKLTLAEAAEVSGYSRDHIGRCVRKGTIANVGRPRSPRVRRGDLPAKPLALRDAPAEAIIPITSKGQIARSVVTSRHERDDNG